MSAEAFSSGADCHVRELAPGRWQYEMQCWPYTSLEDYDIHRPFATYAAARTHMALFYQPPRVVSVHPLRDGRHQHEYDEARCISCGSSKEAPDAVVSS